MSDVPAGDDPSIGPDTELWRRIPPWQWVRDDSVPAGHRPSTDSLDDLELSVVIAAECTGGVETLLEGHDDFGVASFTVAEVRSRGWGVVRAADESLPGHAHVTGRKTKGQRSSLVKTCRMLREPRTSADQ